MTNPTGARSTPLRTLAAFLVENAEPLINAAAVLGGRQAVRRTARLIEDMASAPRLTRRLGRDLVGLHRLAVARRRRRSGQPRGRPVR